MAKERRVFTNYPESLKTDQNNRETFVADDPLYEPEQANFLNGFIGDVSTLTAEDLARTPLIRDITPERQKYQLTVAATFINPDTQVRESYASYTDMTRQIEANGGDTSDPNRVFSTEFYAWTPPIDYDKHINFSRYQWIGPGTADIQGDYVIKEPSHSKTVVHEWDGAALISHDVEIEVGLPAPGPNGTFVEDASTVERFIYRSDGATWQLLSLIMVPDVPTDFTAFIAPVYFYVIRTGPEFQRPLVWKYSDAAGRWLSQPVVVNPVEPDVPRLGMVWEDTRIGSERRLKVFENATFTDLTYTPTDGPPGIPGADGDYIYDTREYGDLIDPWARENWWKHGEDLSSVDRAARTGEDQAIRPILEFWNGLESVAGDTKDSRNDSPVYKKYAIDPVTSEIVDASESTTIFEYQQGSGIDDSVLGFPLSFNDSGEFLFEVTLETDASAFIGYHYFRDIHTGLVHGIWFKSDEFTMQEEDALGLFSIPVGISSNADHEILTVASRSRMLRHMTSIIGDQEGFSGSITGLNSYRWTDKNPTVGATIIDAEKTHLRTLATLQSIQLDVPNATRSMAKEYNKVLVRFVNRLNQMWDNLTLTNGDDTLNVTAEEACDAVLTAQFIGRTDDFPFYFSDMGTFIQTLVEAGIPTVIDPDPKPIFIPPSPTRIGASPCFVPESFMDIDGTTNLRGHEGSILPSFGDERDLVWIELQNRFFNVTPVRFCTETTTFSALFSEANFRLKSSYGNYVPVTSIEPVDDVVPDFNAIVGPADGVRVFSTNTAIFAVFSGGTWLTRPALVDDVFLNLDDSEYYIYNGLGTFLIDRFNRPFAFEYTTNEFRNIARRDFERFIIFRAQDFSENTTFSEADPFTWNYSSAGVEGHYKGQYQRIYNSVRPHSHPWEVMGYTVEPDWWRTQYVPDSTASDGTPRYESANAMWADFALGEVDHPSGTIQNDQFVMTGPTPVDASGELLDPIAAGVVDIAKLDTQRIDDSWVFGDGSPQEQEFLNSTFFSFSVALSGYLMKNGEWMDTLWAETYIGVGTSGANTIFRAPHVVHSETLNRPDIEILPVHLEIEEDGSVVQRIGINAWISEFVNINGGSPTTDFGRIVRNTSPALSWKTGGFIVEDRTIISTLSRAEIPFTDVHVLLHKSQPIDSTFSSGILVIREDPVGYRVFGYDPFDPFFTIERPTIPIAGGQVLLEQDFEVEFIDDDEFNVTGGSVFPNKTLQRTFIVTEFTLPSQTTGADTASLAVLVNGQKFRPQHITVNHDTNSITIEDVVELEPGDRIAVQVLTIQSSSTTQVRQFVVNNVNFPYFSSGSGEFDRIEYGRFFESSTDVINFMIGYGRFLVREGWCFDTLSEGGETRDWLLGAKRFARWVIETESPWNPNPQVDVVDADSFFYSPIQDEVNFISPFGQTTNVESIMNGAFGILNRQSQPIPVDETFVTRVDDKLNIKRSNLLNETTEIFGTRVNVNEAEHVVVFSNTTRFNDIVYDPVSGLAQTTLIVDTYRTLNWEGRIEANGYIIDGGTLLPNFEKQAFDFTRFYDRYRTIDDPLRREEARNLYGFVPATAGRIPVGADASKSVERRINSDSSQYMIPIGAADRSRFDYYRGMIQAKGTRRPAYAFARGTSIGRDNFFFHEDWAWKVGPGDFGDTRRENVQIRVDKNDFRDEIQVIQFSGPIDVFNNTIEIENFNRLDLESNTRWILPPQACDTVDTCNLEFPLSRETGLIDVDGFRYFAKLFDQETNFTVLDHVHYDPDVDKFETTSRCLIDFETFLDPARYNVVPARPETTLIDFTPVSGSTLSIGTDGDYFDISSTTARYRLWFNVEGLETTEITMPTTGASLFAVDEVSGGGTVPGNAWLLNAAPGDVPNHVWYSVEDSEVSSVLFTGLTPNLFTDAGLGDFFTLSVVGGFYHVWFDIKDVNTDPLPPDSLGGIRVGLTGGETDTLVAFAVSDALNAFQNGAVFSASIPVPSEEIVRVVNIVAGAVDDVANGVGRPIPVTEIGLVITQNEVNYDGTGSNGAFVKGFDYVVADTITLSDGSLITIDAVVGNFIPFQDEAAYNALGSNGTFFPGTGYVPSDTITLTDGTVITVDTIINNLIGSQDETGYDGIGNNGTFVAGAGYAAFDIITLSDGTVLTVDVVGGGGVVTDFTVTTPSTTNIIPSVALTQTSTSGVGVGFTLTPESNNITFGIVTGFTVTSPSTTDVIPGVVLTQNFTSGFGVSFTLTPGSNNITFGIVSGFTVTTTGGTFITAGVALTQDSTTGIGVDFELIPEDVNIELIQFETLSQGTGPNLDPGLTAIGHKVIVSASDSDVVIADATATVLAAVPEFANTTQSGSVVTVVNGFSGNVTDATDVNTGVSIVIVDDGTGTPNTEPPADGNVLTRVTVTAIATNQQVSDAVVAVLAATDSDFSDATNGNGIVPIVRVRLTTVGAVTNTAIGVFPVPPILSIKSGVTAKDNGAFIWEEKQVGCTWWRPARKLFIDYRGLLPNYEDAAKVWGLLLYFKSTLVREDDVVTITTYDFTDIDRVTPVPHGVPVGADVIVSIRKASQLDYNEQNITVTAINTTELQYEIDTEPDSPATGDPELVLGHMDVYEWVESPVLPTEWEDFVAGLDDPTHPNGTPLNVDNPSFVEIQRLNVLGQSETVYFFWVLNSSGDNGKGNDLTSQDIARRLANPTNQGIPWFSPVDETNMIIFTDGEKVEDGYGIEILIDRRFLQSHYAFVLITEGSQFFPIPEPVVEKMADSLSGLDSMGNEVPSPLLAQDEKFGSCFFPIQTVFADREAAVDVYVVALNAILKGKNLSDVDILTGIFKLADEFDETTNPTGYWQRTAFVDPRVAGQDVFDTVASITERDRRATAGFYFPDDIVRVIASGNDDAWTGSEVPANFQFDGTSFITVGIDNNTAAVNSNIVDPPARFRGTPENPNGLYFFIYEVLEKIEQNSLMFSLLYEMKVQHPDPRCDWYFKTSYVSTQIVTQSDKSPFVRPDEASAIRNNLLDTKAFRSKFRADAATTEISEIEPFETNILEFPDKKITLVLDRLSCNTIDDCGWDSPAWDARALPCDVWDKPLWEFDDLGRDEFYVLATFQGDGGTTFFVADAIFDPTAYEVSIVIRQNGVVVQPTGLEVTIIKSHVQVFVTVNFALGPTFELDIIQSQGFYQDSDPTFIGTTLDDSSFEPTPSDYKHAVARTVPQVPPTEFRTVVGGDGNTFTTTAGPFIEIYLNGVLQSQGVDYTTDFDYAAFEFSAVFAIAPIPGDDLAFVFMRGCLDINDPLGGRPEERIVTEVCDSVNICVINDYTQAYLSWDATPWDTAFWDQGPTNIGRRVFIISVGKQLEIPPGVEFFVTSEDIAVTDPTAIIGTEPQNFDIVQLELNKGSGFVIMTEGVEFEFVGTLSNLIRTKSAEQEDFISDGVGIVFQTNAGAEIEFVFYNGALMTESVNYTLDITRTEITWVVPLLLAGDLISATFVSFIEAGDTVRYRFNGWPVGPLGNFTVPPFASPLDTLTYDVTAGVFTFGSLPPAGETFSVTYTVARPNGLPESILVRMQEIVADILPDNTAYDAPNGFNTFRAVGTRIINTTTNLIYEWDGVIWNVEPVPVAGTQYYVTRTQQIYEFNGAIFVKLFDVGDVFTNPPVLDFPPFGQGITYGTYAFGTAIPDAPIEWPDAFQVMQHPGDCPP